MEKELASQIKQVAKFFGIEIRGLLIQTTLFGNTIGTCNADGVMVTFSKVREGEDIRQKVARCLLNAIS